MANSEYGSLSPIYTSVFTLPTAPATGFKGQVVPNFYRNNSKVVSIKRLVNINSSGCYPYIEDVNVDNLGNCSITLGTSDAGTIDESVYLLSWVNTSDPSKWGN